MDRLESGHSDSSAPAPREPLTVFPFPPPAAVRQTTDTVINPERRGSSSLPPGAPSVPPAGSTLWPRLFPQDDGSNRELEGPAGARLEHFVIEERIGVGGMGAVFRAVDQRLQRVVALKVLSPVMSRDPGAVQRFQNEARAAARLDHDNIARVHYIGEDRGLNFIAFEYVTGTNLRDLIQRQGRLAPAEAVNYALQIATALVHTSAAGVVHRDIKPSNIIVTPSGRTKLVDLGLARKQNSESVGELTVAGTTLGTFDYISPEQAKDPRNVDVRSDIYSLGCTMYHMLTGEPPYPEGTVLQKLLDHQGKEPPDVAARNGAVPADLSAVIRRMMASEPRRRFTTAEDLLRHLLPIAARMGLRGLHPEGLVWVKPPSLRLRFWERHLGWMASAAVLIVLVLLVDRWPRRTASTPRAAAIADRDAAPSVLAANDDSRSGNGLPGATAPERVLPDESGRPQPGKDDTDEATADQNPAGRRSANSTVATDPDDEPGGDRQRVFDEIELQSARFPTPLTEADAADAAEDPDAADEASAGTISANGARETPVPPPEGGTAADTPPTQASVAPVPATTSAQRPFVVLADGKETGKPTLEAACADAKSGATIELRYDGHLPGVVEKPLRIVNKSLTIRAGTRPGSGERYRPLIDFAADSTGDPRQTRMMTLADASIELINVDLALNVDSNLRLHEDQWWSLISLAGNGTVRLQGASVTVLNPGGQPAAVVEIAPGTAADLPGMMKMMSTMGTGSGSRFSVEISRSLVRGDCDVFVSRQAAPGRFELGESLVAVKGSLLTAMGAVDLPERDRELELDLSHVTCLVGESLIRVESGDLPRQQLPIHVASATNNIIAAAIPGQPLVAMAGNTPGDEFRRLLRWNGAHNFYDGFDSFWSITSSRDFTTARPDTFEEWKEEWSSRSDSTGDVDAVSGGILWKQAWRTIGFELITPNDAALDTASSNNPAIGAASGGDDVGADLSLLPPGLDLSAGTVP